MTFENGAIKPWNQVICLKHATMGCDLADT